MENILKIIYNSSKKGKTLTFKNIEKLLELLINEKQLEEYISDIHIQQIGSNKLASYSNYERKITIYTSVVNTMLNDIENTIKTNNTFEIFLYKNLSLLQVILHELEHANQEKILYTNNTLEAFLLRISQFVLENDLLYEYKPEERFAEIKSFDDIITLFNMLEIKNFNLSSILKTDKLQRELRGYHFKNNKINIPLFTYFILGNKESLLNAFDWYLSDYNKCLEQVSEEYDFNQRLFYGFPISINEYAESTKRLVLSTNNNFRNKIYVQKWNKFII